MSIGSLCLLALNVCLISMSSGSLCLLVFYVYWIIVSITLFCSLLGLIFCPGTTLLTSKDIEWRIQTCSASAVVVSGEDVHKVDEVL